MKEKQVMLELLNEVREWNRQWATAPTDSTLKSADEFADELNKKYEASVKSSMKQETFEEFLEREGYDEGRTQEIWEDGARKGAEWQAKQMYSKEELADLIDATFQGRQDVADLFSELLENLKTK